MEIPEIIRMMTESKFAFGAAVLGKVISVSGSTCNVLAVEKNVELQEVRLQTEASNGILLKPAVDSYVIVSPMNDVEFVVVMYSAIDEIKLLDGSYGGLVMVNELTTKVNNLETLLNNVLTTLKATVIPLAPSGTYPFASLYASLSNLTPTVANDIQSTKITHGTT